ncbi:phage tail sheath subtilisin-like domain-containing protein [Bosea sp. (in: a-proteobacteria)]|uniref:phage tail sheath subtilisin-like domain-containing protein n=1 Tax=Bosea sp. (in: a-proteobacteria) TaxID=1871050 RepID=UPI001ACE1D7C|nr:phage tail sheath subtilisin-like domain-containing protein [Bosea sp. (in: a-proteobacteria)]MBN9438985.1 phage tail sheath subtilisin-like domain-containing protein [Bosea sp. (in: a-proteobacteria)]
MINFDQIPYDWQVPGTYVETRPIYQDMGLVPFPAAALLIVQMLPTGTAVPGRVYEITRPDDAAALFGRGSVGQQMVRAFKRTNRTNRLFVIALADLGAGVKATKALTFTGAGAGTIPLYIQGRRVRYKATSAMTPTQHATAAVAAVNSDADMPVVATSAAGVMTLTAKHAGEVGNHIDVRLRKTAEDVLPGTLAIAIATGTAGSGNPTVQTALDAVVNAWHTDIAMPWDDAANMEAMAAWLVERYQAMGKKDGHVYVGHQGTYGQLGTKGALTNCPHITSIGFKAGYQSPWQWAASLCGLATFHLTNDPARQLRSLALVDIDAPDDVDCFTETERDLLLRQGISTWTRLVDGSVVLERVITAYKVSNLGVSDPAWLDIMVPKTLTRIRYDWASYATLMYPRHKLAPDDSVAANNNDVVVTPKRMLGSWSARCKLYERQAWIIDVARTIEQSRFEIDASNKNRLNGQQRINIIGNLMVLAAALEFEA